MRNLILILSKMKKLISIIIIFFSLQSHSQCRNTFVYGFELVSIEAPELVTAKIFYKGKPIVRKTETICGKQLKIKKQFTFLQNSTKNLDDIKLPYQLPANRFYWLMTDDMTVEMATHPDRFKIVLNSNDKTLKAKYELPITYDFLSQNAIYLDLINKDKISVQKEFKDKIWKFALYEKGNKSTLKDTILVYSAREKIPDGILFRFPELKNTGNRHSVEDFWASGILFNQKLFLKISENKIPKPEQQNGLYISMDGKKCATSGGITGGGFGECAGATNQKGKKPVLYQINIQIEP
ncbi:MAG TPA: hypothetical protein DF603_19375 [Chryseobacterium sp.]|nr:hypothetical protein [Chryseobacterium sp.]